MSSAKPLVQPTDKPVTQHSINPFNGMLRLWLFDVGSVSFLGTGLFGLALSVLAGWAGQKESFDIFVGMGIVSTSAAVAWQLIRLMASECSILIPRYRQNIFIQCEVMLIGVFSLAVLLCVLFDFTSSLSLLVFAQGISLGFILLCLRQTQWFYSSFLLFILVPFSSALAEQVPLWLSIIVLFVLVVLIWRRCLVLPWRVEARSVYLNGLEMGWFWLPNLQSMRFLSRFERYLHPVNFFIGPMLTVLLLLLPVLTLVLGVLSHQFNWDFPVLLLLAQFCVISCSLVHWSRVQRARATELLLLMPGFDGRTGLVNAFARGQQRLLYLISVGMLLCSVFITWLNGGISAPLLAHLVMSTYWACALVLGLGCLCRRVLQVSLTMLVVLGHSLWVSISLAALQHDGHLYYWLIGDLLLVVLGQIALFGGRKKLWRGDIVGL
ncbi:ABC transporter permease [Shewanella xiamenensis]|uniref:ABC transporter permease n=1 Tax=Shewanella xiamenensis TaxID=332186 RepID=UPI001184DF97|nr:ABC transporter permease [Shewanella xiamenensis]TVL16952.1 ABC transporter permease [Shewanella xiamenensis]TVL20292.1 ABC transporter permease [Shewanella xiamenensis]TVL24710.1 ABC transporter permease [Shewanella xiamenensis]TVL33664.1 ABC transporter permease [Shewanella xiamenensis]TVP00360.1 ABC transporter permease [Shewanella xiamenensis]